MKCAKESFVSIKPHQDLEGQISYYYFHQSYEETFSRQFTYYPHYKNALTVYKNCQYKIIDESEVEVDGAPTDRLKLIYSRFYDEIARVKLNGKINKLGIVFQPLGIQHFIEASFSECFPHKINSFQEFEKDFYAVLEKVFEEDKKEKKADLLDAFFRNRRAGFKEKRVKIAIEKLLQYQGCISVNELSEDISVSRRTLLRLFKKHLGCSVEEYRKLIKFRMALEKIQKHERLNLTQISAENYYDQSDFIKQFKTLTQLQPKKFIAEITRLGEEDTFWNFKR